MREGWTYKKLGEVATVSAGQGAPQGNHNYCDNGTPFIKAGNLEDLVNGFPEEKVQNVSEEVAKSHKLKKYKAGSVLFAKSGMSCMKGWVYTIKKDCYVVSHLAIVTPSAISSHFLNYYFCYHRPNLLVQDSAYPSISLKDIEALKVPVPSLQEQQQIVSELDLLSSVIEKQKAQIEDLDKLAQSIFYDMFGDPVENERGWEVRKLGEVCSHITDGDHMPPPKADKGIPFITISNIDKDYRDINFEDTFFVPQRYYDNLKDERKARQGDVLYTVTGSYGIPVIVVENKPFCFQRHIALLRPNNDYLLPLYLCYWALMDSVKQMADDVATGIAQKTVGLSSLRKFVITIPPLSLQQEFANKIQAIESMKAKVRQSLKESETLFNSRMDFYFS